MMSKSLASLGLLLLLLSTVAVTESSFLDEPVVQWTYQLPDSGVPGGRGFRKNNAVVASSDGQKVFATVDDGSLLILEPEASLDGKIYEPEIVPGRYTEGRGGVTLRENDNGVEYVVYSVIDTPASFEINYGNQQAIGDSSDVTSRVIAVNGDGSPRWSIALDGYVVGTPLVGSDGDKIYVAHNIPNATNPIVAYQGRITVLSDSGGSVLVAAQIRDETRFGPYSPMTIKPTSIDGTERDYVVFGESWGDGYIEDGRVYVLSPSADFDANSGFGQGSYRLNVFSELNLPTVTRPVISDDFSAVYLGVLKSQLVAILETNPIEMATTTRRPSWVRIVQPTERNLTQPTLNAPVLSGDAFLSSGGSVYMAGSSYDFFSFNGRTRLRRWFDADDRSAYMVEAKIFEPVGASHVVYIIEYLTGKVRQHDAATGVRNWVFDCVTLTGNPSCEDSVEAEFSLSGDGSRLFYGDVSGKLTGLEVARFTPEPSQLPSLSPSLSSLPTGTTTMFPSAEPSDQTTPSPSSGLVTSGPTMQPVTAVPVVRVATKAPFSSTRTFAPFAPSNPTVPTSLSTPTPPTSFFAPTVSPSSVPSLGPPPVESVVVTPSPSSGTELTTGLSTDTISPSPFNQPNETESSNRSSRRGPGALLIAVIASIAALCLVTSCLGFFLLGNGRKHRERERYEKTFGREPERKKSGEGQSRATYANRDLENELLEQLQTASPQTPPPRKSKRKKPASPHTASTLASIEEDMEEDRASSFESSPDGPRKVESLEDEDDLEESKGSYLPRALTESFDTVASTIDENIEVVGEGNTQKKPLKADESTPHKHKEPQKQCQQPSTIPAASSMLSNDDSSTQSMYVDDNHSIDTASLYIEGDDSTLGEDRSIRTVKSGDSLQNRTPLLVDGPPRLPTAQGPAQGSPPNRREASSLAKTAYYGPTGASNKPKTPMSQRYRELLREGQPGTSKQPATQSTDEAEFDPYGQSTQSADSEFDPYGPPDYDSPTAVDDDDDDDDDSAFSAGLNTIVSQQEVTPQPSRQRQIGSVGSPTAATLSKHETPGEAGSGVWSSFMNSLAKAEHDFFNPTLSSTKERSPPEPTEEPTQEPRPTSPPVEPSQEVMYDLDMQSPPSPPPPPPLPVKDPRKSKPTLAPPM